jgi:hypothetical protein
MKTVSAIDRIRRELSRVLNDVRGDLERVEILTGALNAFNKPVPDYEPAFQHINGLALKQHQI